MCRGESESRKPSADSCTPWRVSASHELRRTVTRLEDGPLSLNWGHRDFRLDLSPFLALFQLLLVSVRLGQCCFEHLFLWQKAVFGNGKRLDTTITDHHRISKIQPASCAARRPLPANSPQFLPNLLECQLLTRVSSAGDGCVDAGKTSRLSRRVWSSTIMSRPTSVSCRRTSLQSSSPTCMTVCLPDLFLLFFSSVPEC